MALASWNDYKHGIRLGQGQVRDQARSRLDQEEGKEEGGSSTARS